MHLLDADKNFSCSGIVGASFQQLDGTTDDEEVVTPSAPFSVTRRRARQPIRDCLAVFAHPDDAELTCFGTLLRIRKSGGRVTIVSMTRGEGSSAARAQKDPMKARVEEASAAADSIGAELVLCDFPDGAVCLNCELVGAIERLIDSMRPAVVITHSVLPAGTDHQDHLAIGAAVTRAARHSGRRIPWLLMAEPPCAHPEFVPNLYVDVTVEYDAKLAALNLHRTEMSKPATDTATLRARAVHWAALGFGSDCGATRLAEAYRIVRASVVSNVDFLLGA
jgi:LmbE family N-acetylglucosaminyl deacetylase